MADIDIESPGGSASSLEAAVRKLAFQRRGCRATRATNWTAQNLTTAQPIPWTSEDYDTDDCHDNVTNNTRLTVPSGFTRVRLTAFTRGGSVTTFATDFYIVNFRKNGSDVTFVGNARSHVNPAIVDPYGWIRSAELTVVAGDYFEVMVRSQADTSSDITTQSWFEMELIG